MSSDVRHYCGLFGIANRPDAAQLTYLGLYALQHRGQESAGICSADGRSIRRRAGLGLVTEAIGPRDLEALTNPLAIGHVRYSTTGSCSESNSQPLLVTCSIGQVGICHNGNLVNAAGIRREYEQQGHIFVTTSDTEVILHMLADQRFVEKPDPLAAVLRQVRGSYCLLLLYPDRIEAVRDPSGNRPLCLGQVGPAWVVASETCALDIIDASYVRDVEPGEIVTLTAHGISSRRFTDPADQRRAQCIFEHVYFADPSSQVFGQNVHRVRMAMGRALAQEAPADADLVIAVPNCARCAALGYHEASGIPIGRGFTTNHYVGRSFIQPTQTIRDLTVRLKLNPIRGSVAGRRRGRVRRPRDDNPRQDAVVATGRGPRDPPAGGQPAGSPPLLLRHRLPQPRGTRRSRAFRRGNPAVPRRGLAGVSVAEGDADRGAGVRQRVLPRLFHRGLPYPDRPELPEGRIRAATIAVLRPDGAAGRRRLPLNSDRHRRGSAPDGWRPDDRARFSGATRRSVTPCR